MKMKEVMKLNGLTAYVLFTRRSGMMDGFLDDRTLAACAKLQQFIEGLESGNMTSAEEPKQLQQEVEKIRSKSLKHLAWWNLWKRLAELNAETGCLFPLLASDLEGQELITEMVRLAAFPAEEERDISSALLS